MRTRLRDVADRAGVSVKTVCNVVNGYDPRRPREGPGCRRSSTRPATGPTSSARNLRAGRTGVIALALPELDHPYFAELTRCVVKAAEARGLTVLVDQTDGLREREADVLRASVTTSSTA